MKKTIEDFENNVRPEWNKETNWAKIENKITSPKILRKAPWLLLLLGLSIFGSGYALSYYIHRGKDFYAPPKDVRIKHDTIQILVNNTDTIVQYRKELVYQVDTIFIEKELAVNLVPGFVEKDKKIELTELPEFSIPVPEFQFKKPDIKLPRTGKRTSKPYATNVFFDDTTKVLKSEFRIFHRIEGKFFENRGRMVHFE